MTESSRRSSRSELAEFLRSRRARVRPEDVGLSGGSRRRTPGLRREEVARLAEVGISWYTWLEQGRDIQVSEPFLERLARALRLNPAERAHLFELAQGRPPPRLAITPASVSPALQRVLDVHPFPGLVTTPRWDVVAWNPPAVILYGDYALRPPAQRNILWSAFTSPRTRLRTEPWESHARGLVARFRLDAGRAADRTEFDALVAELSEVSPEFRRFWSEHDVLETAEGVKSITHPEVGVIEFEHVTLTHSEPDGRLLRITLYGPRPGVSTTRARKLFGAVTR
ncbi:transcriptional regulator [Cystobacter fuscus]|uniref:Transcriptional regulator n=1 Tax=Cystobacter fuscus TaxID=43 RepID=A0A250JI68_9BACT|nr:helix-turn-helix transcriptional regulator [Cystobacter fuscus]ATB42846.1 transcriptional regulator [Cystobacter fuscus]